MSLREWQTRLDVHFKKLRETRSVALGEAPIYTLEHGLSKEDREDLSNEIKSQISDSWPQDDHWLPWIVYATELGYNYDGEEYWQSFERRTPGWTLRGNRDWIRNAFQKFHSLFNGAVPSGRWARHFSIICWPITHAILPVDLQRQLAQSLFEMRYSFHSDLLKSPELLGQQIAVGSWKFSSRFRILAQQPLLLGQIATALLFPEEDRTNRLILSSSLLRIAKDLDEERRAREWLKDAQGVARTRLHGIIRGDGADHDADERSPSDQLRSLGIEPSVFLRPTTDSWEVILEIPDLAPLLSRFPSLHGSLDESLCWVAGSNGRPLAKGRLFHYGSQFVALSRWPSPKEILLRFEKTCPEIEYLLSAECMLRPGPVWLYKISPDGYGYEIRGRAVRTDCKYIVLKTEGEIQNQPGTVAVKIPCEGISASLINIPTTLDQESLQHLADLGLNPSTRMQIAPIGVPAVRWDGEGRVEWLSTDRPCICLSGDRPLRGILLNLQGPVPDRLEFTVDSDKDPLFFELGELVPGKHKLHVVLQLSDSEEDFIHGYIDILVRNPRAWTEGLTDQNPLFVVVDPPNPSLEQLWGRDVSMELHGPPNRQVSPQIRFYTRRVTNECSFQKALPTLDLPVSAPTWQSYFKDVQRDKSLQGAFDDAIRAEISFDAQELGHFRLSCERDESPLYWSVRWENHSYVLRLYDDTGESSVTTAHYSFERPDTPIEIESRLLGVAGFRVPESGGVYVASTSTCTSAIVAPPVLKQLTELRIEPQLSVHARSTEEISKLLSLRNIWANARTTGNPLSATRRETVVEALMTEILRSICGAKWIQVEKEVRLSPDQITKLKAFIWDKPPGTSLGVAILAKKFEFQSKPTRERVKEFLRLVKSYLDLPAFETIGNSLPFPDEWIAEFALRLVTSPRDVVSWSQDHFNTGMEFLFKWPQLPRSARTLALSIGSPGSTDYALGTTPAQWEWS
jgi:hypothetical protein